MIRAIFLICCCCCSLAFAGVPFKNPSQIKKTDRLISFQLHEVRLVDLMRVVYGDLLNKSFLLDADFLGATEIISLDWHKLSSGNVDKLVREIINHHGFDIEQRSGVFFVRKKSFDEIFIYRPLFRSSKYLSDIVSALTGVRILEQPAYPGTAFNPDLNLKLSGAVPIANSQMKFQAPQKNDDGFSNDQIVLNVQSNELAKVKKLLADLDVPSGEIVLKAAVYEVGTVQGDGGAVQVVAGLLKGHINGSIGSVISGANTIGYVNGGLDVVLSLLDQDSRFKTVSRPMVRVRSGAQARFSVGQDVPVLGQAVLDKNGNPVQSIDYRQSGVILTVTPEVRESVIDLDISQELSSFIATSTGVNNSPTLLKRSVNSKLSIKAGEVVIFAGLNETKTDQTQSRFLGFKVGDQSNQGQTEILIFVEAQRI